MHNARMPLALYHLAVDMSCIISNINVIGSDNVACRPITKVGHERAAARMFEVAFA